jgi:tetratricopeptide (TPR) repeat protein
MGGPGMRLDSWKEIATYLGKVERTVKRWETNRGLPIHRLPGRGGASVYAFTRELDDWLKSTSARGAEVASEATVQLYPSSAQFSGPEPPATESSHIPRASASQPFMKQEWLQAFVGLLLFASFVGISVYSAGLGTASQRLSRSLENLFADRTQERTRGTPISVTDSEKSQARDLYLKGRYEWNQRTPESLNRALDCFTQAILHDPGDAQAYVGMADTYDLLREYSTMPDSEAYTRAIAAARKAVELDDSLAEAHRALAFAEWWGSWDFADGEKEFRRAIELNPRDPVARKWYANVLSVQGRFAEGLEENEKAQELDPTSHSILADKGWMLFNAGKKDEGLAVIKDVERSAPEFLSPHHYLMNINLIVKDYPSYLEEGQKTADGENDPVLKDIVASARAGYKRDGERGLLTGLYNKQMEYFRAGKLSGTTMAKTCVLMGKKHEALQLLKEAYDRHETHVLACVSESDLLLLRDEPEYRELVKKISFPQGPQNAGADTFPSEDQPSLRAASDPH